MCTGPRKATIDNPWKKREKHCKKMYINFLNGEPNATKAFSLDFWNLLIPFASFKACQCLLFCFDRATSICAHFSKKRTTSEWAFSTAKSHAVLPRKRHDFQPATRRSVECHSFLKLSDHRLSITILQHDLGSLSKHRLRCLDREPRSCCSPASMSALDSNKPSAASKWPLCAAQCKGVPPSSLHFSMSALDCIESRTTSRWPEWEAYYTKGVAPSSSHFSMSPSASSKRQKTHYVHKAMFCSCQQGCTTIDLCIGILWPAQHVFHLRQPVLHASLNKGPFAFIFRWRKLQFHQLQIQRQSEIDFIIQKLTVRSLCLNLDK